jgi:hypothetical protein
VSQKPLTDKQLEIIPVLSQGLSYQQITDSTGVPKPTVARWAKLAQIQAEVAEIQKGRIEVCRKVVTGDVDLLQERLRESLERQKQYIATAQIFAFNCSKLAESLIEKAPSLLENETLTPRLLGNLLPAMIKASNDSFRLASELEDKIYALEEISHRLDEWESYREGANSQNSY